MFKLLLFVAMATITTHCTETSSSITKSNNDNDGRIDSVNSVYNQIIIAANAADADKVVSFYSRSPNLYIVAGNTTVFTNLDSFQTFLRTAFRPLAYQRTVMREPNIRMLSDNDAVLTTGGDFNSTRKDSTTFGGQFVWTLIFSRDAGNWKVVNYHECVKLN